MLDRQSSKSTSDAPSSDASTTSQNDGCQPTSLTLIKIASEYSNDIIDDVMIADRVTNLNDEQREYLQVQSELKNRTNLLESDNSYEVECVSSDTSNESVYNINQPREHESTIPYLAHMPLGVNYMRSASKFNNMKPQTLKTFAKDGLILENQSYQGRKTRVTSLGSPTDCDSESSIPREECDDCDIKQYSFADGCFFEEKL